MREQTQKTLVDRFLAQWGTTLPVAVDNQPFKQPEGGAWGRLSFVFGDNQPASITTTQSRCIGFMFLQVFMPEDTGTMPARKAADKLESIFKFQTLPLPFSLPTTGRVVFDGLAAGPTPAGLRDGYAQHNIRMEFRAEQEN